MLKNKVDRILNYLNELYPYACCELDYYNVFELLVAVMLSAQTTDKKVNKVTKTLFTKYTDIESIANASIEELENEIKSIGLYHNKAKNLHKIAKIINDEYNGVVPCNRKALESLPGVGRKTANVVLSVGFNIPNFAVDTHVERIAKRLGFAKKDVNVDVVERNMKRYINRNLWIKTHHQFIFFGRYFCKAINPNCKQCKLIDICKDKEKQKEMLSR